MNYPARCVADNLQNLGMDKKQVLPRWLSAVIGIKKIRRSVATRIVPYLSVSDYRSRIYVDVSSGSCANHIFRLPKWFLNASISFVHSLRADRRRYHTCLNRSHPCLGCSWEARSGRSCLADLVCHGLSLTAADEWAVDNTNSNSLNFIFAFLLPCILLPLARQSRVHCTQVCTRSV